MDYVSIITLAAKKVGVSAGLLLAICSHESHLKDINNENDKGTPSIGVCQVKMDTALMFGFKGDRYSLQKPSVNAKYAALFLKYQFDRYHDPLKALSAYNAGSYFESKKIPGCPKNKKYVEKVRKFVSDPDLFVALSCNLILENVAEGDTSGVTTNGN